LLETAVKLRPGPAGAGERPAGARAGGAAVRVSRWGDDGDHLPDRGSV